MLTKEYLEFVKATTNTVLKTIIGKAFTIVLVWLVFSTLIALAFNPVDNSDVDRWNRSEMRIHTDALTGCQYLSTRQGSITPRLHSDGVQVCGEDR